MDKKLKTNMALIAIGGFLAGACVMGLINILFPRTVEYETSTIERTVTRNYKGEDDIISQPVSLN